MTNNFDKGLKCPKCSHRKHHYHPKREFTNLLEESTQNVTNLQPSHERVRWNTIPLPTAKAREHESIEDIHTKQVNFYIKSIVLGAWKPLIDTPPQYRYVCITLLILAQIELSYIIVSIISSSMFALNLLYLILAIPASYITILDWVQKQWKQRQLLQQTDKKGDHSNSGAGQQ
jgi:hypothetical protein